MLDWQYHWAYPILSESGVVITRFRAKILLCAVASIRCMYVANRLLRNSRVNPPYWDLVILSALRLALPRLSVLQLGILCLYWCLAVWLQTSDRIGYEAFPYERSGSSCKCILLYLSTVRVGRYFQRSLIVPMRHLVLPRIFIQSYLQ